MSFRRRIEGFFNRSKRVEPGKGARSIKFQPLDFRDPEAAKEQNLDPGYYFIVKVSPDDMIDEMGFLARIASLLQEYLDDQGLIEGKDEVRIPIAPSDGHEMDIDPSTAYSYKLMGSRKNQVLIKAAPVDPGETQNIYVKALNR